MHARPVQIRFPGTHAGFAQAFERFCTALDAERLYAGPRYNAELIFEEIVANIVRYGAVDGRDPDVRVTLEPGPESILVTFDDDGVPFDPCASEQPRPPKSRDEEEEKIGGFGLKLVRSAASSLEYIRTGDGRNRLTVRVAR
jgi:anti-sigma regulatory factor (Ser/Thr protein kinase)